MSYRALMVGKGSLADPQTLEATSAAAPAGTVVQCAHPLPWRHLLAASALGSLVGGLSVVLIDRRFLKD